MDKCKYLGKCISGMHRTLNEQGRNLVSRAVSPSPQQKSRVMLKPASWLPVTCILTLFKKHLFLAQTGFGLFILYILIKYVCGYLFVFMDYIANTTPWAAHPHRNVYIVWNHAEKTPTIFVCAWINFWVEFFHVLKPILVFAKNVILF